MPLVKKAPAVKKDTPCSCDKDIGIIYTLLKEQAERLEAIEGKLNVPVEVAPRRASIQRTEEFNGELPPEPYEGSSITKMGYGDKIQSAINACKILPPNMIVDGRHSCENIEALCGFKVDKEMMDDIYKDLVHEE